MSLLQRYIFRQAFWPVVISLLGLAGLALLVQSLNTLELIVRNRQSAGTFFWITILALPQLISIILPMAVLLASLYSLNRLNTDSELVVARATGIGPWQITSPILRLALMAAVVHLIINLFVQPSAFREMRASLLEVRTDIASKMILPGEFTTPVKNLTLYGQNIEADGTIINVIIHDERSLEEQPTTYVAERGQLSRSEVSARLTLFDGSIQKRVDDGNLDFVAFESHQIDLSDVVAEDTVLRLKTSDRYLHELTYPNASDLQKKDEFMAEAHNRLASPLYSPALALLALVFMARGRHQRLGYGRQIALCALLGFVIRLSGFSVSAAAEGSPALNLVQYAIPLATIALCLAILVIRRRIKIEETDMDWAETSA
jgi:lipopolysaccharide export system permease protein